MIEIRPYSTLRKLRENADVTVYCSRCGHSGPLPFDALASRIGWDTELEAIPPLHALVKCSRCELKVGEDGRDDFGHTIKTSISPACARGGYHYPAP